MRLKPPSWDEMPTAPQTRRGGSNIHDEPSEDALDAALSGAASEPEGVTLRRGRASDATTTRRPSQPPNEGTTQRRPSSPPSEDTTQRRPSSPPSEDTTQRRSSAPPPAPEGPRSIPRWDDESLPFADARELAKQLEPEKGGSPAPASVEGDDDPLEHDWDDLTVPKPRPSPTGPPAPQPPPRRVSTSAPQSADFPSVGQPAVVVSPVLVLDSKEPPPSPEWVEAPPTAPVPPSPEPERHWLPWLVVVLLLLGTGTIVLALAL